MPEPHPLAFDLRAATPDDIGKHVRTANEGANAPILHINREMGYRLVSPVIELHRSLAS